MRPTPLLVALPLAAAVGCGGTARTAPPASPTPPPSSPPIVATTSSPSPSASPTLPAFASSVAAITAADLPSSYHAGCPTPPSQLRMLTLSYVDFDGAAQTGHLVVAADQAAKVIAVFADLYVHRFPIRQMVPVDAYGGSDERSLAADNTAGFNCRLAVTTGPASWSMHAYGDAIDVDPVENPYIESGGTVDPPNGEPYVDRTDVRPGMAESGGELALAFARQGWQWGASFADYQHFSTNGR